MLPWFRDIGSTKNGQSVIKMSMLFQFSLVGLNKLQHKYVDSVLLKLVQHTKMEAFRSPFFLILSDDVAVCNGPGLSNISFWTEK